MEIIKFGQPCCGPCKAQAKILEQVGSKYGIKVTEVDVTEDEDMTLQYGIRTIPTCVVLEDGKEVARWVGLKTLADVEKIINYW